MNKKAQYVFRFTCNSDGNDRIYKVNIESENEKFALKKFEKKYTNCNILCITKM